MAAAPNPCIHLEAMEETEDQVEKIRYNKLRKLKKT